MERFPPPGVLVKNGDGLEYTFARPSTPSDLTDVLGVELSYYPQTAWNTLDKAPSILSDTGGRQQAKFSYPRASGRCLSGCG
jgi:hypothetical protein